DRVLAAALEVDVPRAEDVIVLASLGDLALQDGHQRFEFLQSHACLLVRPQCTPSGYLCRAVPKPPIADATEGAAAATGHASYNGVRPGCDTAPRTGGGG